MNVPAVNHDAARADSPSVMRVACVLLEFLGRLAFAPDREALRRVAWLLSGLIILVVVIRVPLPAGLPVPWLF